MVKKIVFSMVALMVLAMTYSMPAVAADKLIRIDGSSTVYPITEAVAEEYQKAKRGEVKVTVGISGTGGGFKKSLQSLFKRKYHCFWRPCDQYGDLYSFKKKYSPEP